VVNDIKNQPERKLLVIDPRRTETADVADLHLSLRPGTDAFLLAAMIAMIIERNAHHAAWLAQHTDGFPRVAATLAQVPVADWVAHADVAMADVERAVDMILAAKAMTVRVELGIQQGRHSTLNSYLEKLLYLLTGNFGRAGTNALHTWLQPLWANSKGQRSEITGVEYIAGLLPPNTLVEEIRSDHPHRVRALWVESSNPANTVADTAAVEAAIRACELSVVVDIAYTETAALADYVLPAASQHEKWEYTLFTFEWPTNYFHVRRPLFEPLAGTLPESEIYARLFERLGVLPDAATLAELTDVARHDRRRLLQRAGEVMAEHPGLSEIVPVLLYRTLGATLPDGAAHVAPLWLACHRAASAMEAAVQRALDTDAVGFSLGEALFEAAVNSPSGFAFSRHDHDDIWQLVKGDRIQLAIPELLDWIGRLDPAADQPDPDYPFSLVNGQRRAHNANQILRPPAWRKSDPDGALHIHPSDLADLGLEAGDWVAVVTPTGRIVVRAEVDESMRRHQVALPHGFGMSYPDGKGGRVINGPRINQITAGGDRDPIAGTPHHKDVRVRLEAAHPDEAATAEDASARIHDLIDAGTPS
jgi:anaerobic selenocysteine-containing dehydrogenase